MQIKHFGALFLMVASATSAQAADTEIKAPRSRDLDLRQFFTNWDSFKSIYDLHDRHDVKDMEVFEDLPKPSGFKDFLDLKDLIDFKDPYTTANFRPDLTYTLQRIPNKGKDLEEKESKAEMDSDYHGDYDYEYYQDEDDYETPDSDDDDHSDEVYFDLSSLSFIQKEHLKNAGTIEDVSRITGLPLLQDIPHFSLNSEHTSYSSSLRVRSGYRRNSSRGPSFARRAACEPEKVSIPVEVSAGYRPIPSCIRVKKCGGCCNPGMECVATQTKILELKVIEHSVFNDSMREKVMQNVTEHLECGCQCSVKEGNCLPTQDYDKDSCSCICKPNLESVREECEENGRLWDPYQCQCQCPIHTPRSDDDCGSGQKFNSLTCSCEND